MKASVKNQVVAALNAGKALQKNADARKALKVTYDEAIAAICESFDGVEYDVIRAELLPVVAEFYRCPTKAGEGKATGQTVFNSDSANYEAAKKGLQRLMSSIFDGPKKPTNTAAKLLKECGGDLDKAIAALKKAAK